MREHDIRSADGTAIRVWRAGNGGRDVLLCPGLGTMPEAWPYLDAPDARRWRVHSWYHRGTLGSARPSDASHIRLADHVADALAVLDDAGIERAVVMGWSVGAAVACELALRCPDRVAGLLLVAGVPGDPFPGLLGLLGLPEQVQRKIAVTAAQVIRGAGPVLNAVLHRVPVNAVTAALVRHSGVMLPASRTEDVVAAGRRFLSHDWGWYGRMALALAGEPAPDLTGLSCPVTVLVGRYDVIADPKHVARAVGVLPQARLRVLPTSHFLPLEAPAEVAAELALLVERIDAVHGATHWCLPLVVQR
ncbi:MAG TPA: alpha/beta hydrolase [Pseudonocardiaceae bacterium]|nr:alpha/beta hydrolase [Pseudonocardiaceae bacterium]